MTPEVSLTVFIFLILGGLSFLDVGATITPLSEWSITKEKEDEEEEEDRKHMKKMTEKEAR